MLRYLFREGCAVVASIRVWHGQEAMWHGHLARVWAVKHGQDAHATWVSLAICLSLAVIAGCDITLGPDGKRVASGGAPPGKKVIHKKVLTPADVKTKPVEAPVEELDLINKAFEDTRFTSANTGAPEAVAVRRITDEITKSLEVGPTLVVWLVDRTSSASKLVLSALPAAKAFYDNPEIRQFTVDEKQRLLTSLIVFDDKLEFLLDPPSDDWQKVKSAFDQFKSGEGGKELTFTTLKAALDKFLPYRTEQKREVVFVLITDEAGDDQRLADELAPIFTRAALPLYVVGLAAPWGQRNPFELVHEVHRPGAEKATDAKPASDDASPTYGPESRQSERVHLPVPEHRYASFRGTSQPVDMIEAGFGPFALERLCRAGGGEFLVTRPAAGSIYASYRGTASFWPTGAETRFDPAVVARYAPDYVSASDYQKLLAGNRARLALVEAAKIGKAEVLENPNTQFRKLENESQMKLQLDEAQKYSARVAPPLDALYAALQPGEADRDKLESPRWRAEFDYAFGRVLAAKARNDGYNQMVAALKNGKGPKGAGDYSLEQADSYETNSALKKMAEKARFYLERVVKEHPGTPWAKYAEEDLKTPLGWKFRGA